MGFASLESLMRCARASSSCLLLLFALCHSAIPSNADPCLAATNSRSGSQGRGICRVADEVSGLSERFAVLAQADRPEIPEKDAPPATGWEGVKPKLDPFPILSYSTDTGLGYGAKVFLLNQLKRGESLDLIAFNSTKGERWYRAVASFPDCELRQGKVYPIAVDFILDYDKYLKNSFFGIGPASRYSDREFYTKELLEVSLSIGRGFTSTTIAQVGLRSKTVRNYRFAEDGRLRTLPRARNPGRASCLSAFANYRFDTRDSYVDPSRGVVVQGELEYAPKTGFTNVRLTRVGAKLQCYSVLFHPKTVLALRLGVQGLIGRDIPVQMLLPIGGNQTLRGSPQDRFLDRSAMIVNAELRFPIIWRFGGVAGFDAGRVWDSPRSLTLRALPANAVAGLRFHMDTFVVRLDVGVGRETTGFYLNFGQLF